MPTFEELETRMHRECDERLGDVVEVKIPPADFVPMKGYVLRPDISYQIDDLDVTVRLKLRKELLPARPSRSWRFRSAKLGAGAFQIAGDVEDGASHWLFAVQKA